MASLNYFGANPTFVALGDPVWLLATLSLTWTLLLITLEDLRSFRVPNALSLPLMAAGLMLAWVFPYIDGQATTFSDHLIGATAAFLFFSLLGEVVFRRTGQEALGLGDAKLFGAAGAWLGWQALPMVLMIASLSGLCYALIVRSKKGSSAVAFGPWISLGFLVVWLSAVTQ